VPAEAGAAEHEGQLAALGDTLRLADPSGGTGRISSQTPPPGTLVVPASAVSVVLAADEQASWLPPVLAVAVVGALIAALVSARHVRRRRAREQPWLEENVRTELRVQEPLVPAVPDRAASGLAVRLDVRRAPAQLEFQEVDRAGN